MTKPTATKPTATGKPRVCRCGCGATVTREFKQGHDAKLKSRLIDAVLAGEAPKATKAATAAGAKALTELTARGWLGHLEKSRASRAAKAERAARKLAAKAAVDPAGAPAPDAPTPASEVTGGPARGHDDTPAPAPADQPAA